MSKSKRDEPGTPHTCTHSCSHIEQCRQYTYSYHTYTCTRSCLHIDHLGATLSSLAKNSLFTSMSSTMASMTRCAEAAASSGLVEVEMRDIVWAEKSAPACGKGVELITFMLHWTSVNKYSQSTSSHGYTTSQQCCAIWNMSKGFVYMWHKWPNRVGLRACMIVLLTQCAHRLNIIHECRHMWQRQ